MSDKKISQLIGASLPLTGTEQLPLVQGGVTLKATAQDIANLAAFGGTNYIYVMADGTDTANAAELSAAYTAAIALSPSATNRITIVCGPGKYNFGSSAFTMSTQYIDLVSLDGNRSVLFNSANAAGTISITANDVFVKGVDVGTKAFTIATSLNLLKVENCKGGDSSFGTATASGTFNNCTSGNFSFGGSTASGVFTNCTAGTDSFGNFDASGTFNNCVAGVDSFGNFDALGTFNNCTAGDYSFGSNNEASGIFNNCTAGDLSFGALTASGTFTNCVASTDSFGYVGGNLTGKLFYCRLTAGTFTTVSAGGVTRLCLNGSNVQNNQG